MIEARPHPTLAPGSTDFIDGGEFTAFITDRSAKILDEKINFTVCFKCNVSSVNGYLKKGKLSYGLRVKCMGTSYSNFIQSGDDTLHVEIPANHVDGDLELLAVIYAVEEFSFCTGGINADYEQFQFEIPKGGQVGIFELPKIPIDHRLDYQKPLNSIIDIKKIDESEVDVSNARLDKNKDRLTIELPQATYDLWHSIRNRIYPLRNALANILVAPAIIDAVHYMISFREESEAAYQGLLSESKWAKQLDRILDEKGFSVERGELDKKEKVFEAVDKILSGPIEKTMKNLHDFSINDD